MARAAVPRIVSLSCLPVETSGMSLRAGTYKRMCREQAGPFAMLDHVGLDTVWHIMESNARLARSPEGLAAADKFKKQYIERACSASKPARASTPIHI